MSDRENCYRDNYDRDSADILFWLSEDSIKNDVELEYFEYYKKLSSNLSHSEFLVHHYEEMFTKYNNAISNAKQEWVAISHQNTAERYKHNLSIEISNIEIYKKLLSKLELTTPIENILQRERKPNEIITMTFLNRELPNMPYNVLSSRSNFYLSNEENSLIKNILKKEENSNSKEQKPKSKQSIEITDDTQNNKQSVKNKQNYIFCAVIGFILSGLYLLGTADMEYSYYKFVRVISFVVIPMFLYVFWKIEKIDDSLDRLIYIPSGVVWLLFNPIFPFYMSKENWIIFDVICAIVFLIINIFLVFLYRYNKKN